MPGGLRGVRFFAPALDLKAETKKEWVTRWWVSERWAARGEWPLRGAGGLGRGRDYAGYSPHLLVLVASVNGTDIDVVRGSNLV